MQFSIPFSGRSHSYNEEEVNVAVNVMQTATPLTQGLYQKKFEEKIADYCGVDHAFAVMNATSGLELAAKCCALKSGDEVIVPSHTFTSSAYPFVKEGARIVWADIDLKTRVANAETIARCITPNTRVIVVPHLYGYVADMLEIQYLAKKNDLILIEDAAQSLGSKLNGNMAGSFGDFSVFSFHSHKNVTTLGEGGVLIVKDDEIAKLIPLIRHNGHCSFESDRSDYWLPAMGNVDLPSLGNNYIWPSNFCLGEVECAVGTKLLDRIDAINEKKRARAMNFIDELNNFPELIFHRVDSVRHNYHLLVAQMIGTYRNDFIRSMAINEGIQCVVHYCPLNRYPFYKKIGMGEADCPISDKFFDNMISFPFHDSLLDSELDQMLTSTKKVLKQILSE